jgi:hypothetical protein
MMSSLTSHPQAGFNKEKLHSLVQVKLSKEKKYRTHTYPSLFLKKARKVFTIPRGKGR